MKQCAGPPFILPSYLCMELKRKVVRNVSRFRLRAHHLKVESCKWLGGSDVCDKCGCNEVQDEKHALFYCRCAEVCELRKDYKDLFHAMFTPLHAFAHSHGSDFIPYLALFHNITDLEVNTFLNQDSCRLPKFCQIWLQFFMLVSLFHQQPISQSIRL